MSVCVCVCCIYSIRLCESSLNIIQFQLTMLDKYKKEYSGYWNAILSGTGEITLDETEEDDFN